MPPAHDALHATAVSWGPLTVPQHVSPEAQSKASSQAIAVPLHEVAELQLAMNAVAQQTSVAGSHVPATPQVIPGGGPTSFTLVDESLVAPESAPDALASPVIAASLDASTCGAFASGSQAAPHSSAPRSLVKLHAETP